MKKIFTVILIAAICYFGYTYLTNTQEATSTTHIKAD